jgi:hypothetical protein
VSSGTSALCQTGTVDNYTPAQRAKAEEAVRNAGFTPTGVLMAQAGNLFIGATKGGQSYAITVTPDGHVYAEQPPLPRP